MNGERGKGRVEGSGEREREREAGSAKTWTIGVYLADDVFLGGPYENDHLNESTKLISVGVRVAARF